MDGFCWPAMERAVVEFLYLRWGGVVGIQSQIAWSVAPQQAGLEDPYGGAAQKGSKLASLFKMAEFRCSLLFCELSNSLLLLTHCSLV